MVEKANNKNKLIIGGVIAIISVFGIAGAVGMNKDKSKDSDAQNNTTTQTTPSKSNAVAVGTNFSFDKLTLNVSPNYSFKTIDNIYSENNGKTVVALPITITNNDDKAKSLNMYSYKVYGAGGVELEKPSSYFMDDSSDFAGNLQPGVSYTKNLYFLYDGNGTYKIEFGYYNIEAIVSINITK